MIKVRVFGMFTCQKLTMPCRIVNVIKHEIARQKRKTYHASPLQSGIKIGFTNPECLILTKDQSRKLVLKLETKKALDFLVFINVILIYIK